MVMLPDFSAVLHISMLEHKRTHDNLAVFVDSPLYCLFKVGHSLFIGGIALVLKDLCSLSIEEGSYAVPDHQNQSQGKENNRNIFGKSRLDKEYSSCSNTYQSGCLSYFSDLFCFFHSASE